MARDVPLGKQRRTRAAAAPRRTAAARRAGSRAASAPARRSRRANERRRALVVERREIGRGAEIGEQQEAALEILRDDLGRVARRAARSIAATRTNGRQSSRPGGASIAIHDRPPRRRAKIAAEARVGGGGLERKRRGGKLRGEPARKLVAASIDSGSQDDCALVANCAILAPRRRFPPDAQAEITEHLARRPVRVAGRAGAPRKGSSSSRSPRSSCCPRRRARTSCRFSSRPTSCAATSRRRPKPKARRGCASAARRCFADWMRYDKPTDEVYARGNVRIEQGADVMDGSAAPVQPGNRARLHGQRRPTRSTRSCSRSPPPCSGSPSSRPSARGTAERLLFEGPEQYRAQRAEYTTCGPGNDDWYMRGARAADRQDPRRRHRARREHRVHGHADFLFAVPLVHAAPGAQVRLPHAALRQHHQGRRSS